MNHIDCMNHRIHAAFKRCYLLLLLTGVMPLAMAQNASPEQAVIQAVVNNSLLPAHQQLDQRSKVLNAEAEKFCASLSAAALADLRTAWLQAMQSWGALAMVDFGPIETTNAQPQFQFWPDPLNLVQRKFASRIAGKNLAISAEELEKAGVGMQGLSALEYLLFDEALATPEKYAAQKPLCPLLKATAHNLASNAQQLAQLWQDDFGPTFYNLDVEKVHAGYFKRNVGIVLSSMITALDHIRHQKLGLALGMEKRGNAGRASKPGRLNPQLLESWRSQSSLAQIKASLALALDWYQMQHGLSWYLLQKNPSSNRSNQSGKAALLDQKIKAGFAAALSQIDASPGSAEQLLQEKQPATLVQLHRSVSEVYYLLKVDYAKASGIEYRFNARDGD